MRHLLETTAAALVLLLAGCPSFTSSDEPSFHPDKGADRSAHTQPAQAQAQPAQVRPMPTPPPTAGANGSGAPTTISARHILIQYKGAMRAPATVTRTKDEARALAAKVLAKAKQPGADFAALARQYSDGPSGPHGGDLGSFHHGQMVGPFDQAAFKLSVNQVSGIVETPFGFHVIQRYR